MSVAEQVEPVRVNEVAGERHDDFRWQRDARRLDSHQQNDARVAERRDRRHDEGGQNFDYSRDQIDTPFKFLVPSCKFKVKNLASSFESGTLNLQLLTIRYSIRSDR